MSSQPTKRKEDAKKDEKEDSEFEGYLKQLYDVKSVSDDEWKAWSESYSYKGFDRKKVILDLMRKVPDVKVVHQIIMVCGLLGPKRASQTKLLNGRVISSYGIPASNMKGTENVSCQRITAATADLCAYILKKINAPKRLNIDLPAWLQFPSAGSITMPDSVRTQHIEFSKRFSVIIKGSFNEQIYEQMVVNSYYDRNLNLF